MADKKHSRSHSQNQLQTPGAGPSRLRPPDIFVPQPHLLNDTTTLRTRTPTRSDTLNDEVELGIYLRPLSGSGSAPSSPSSGVFARRGSNGTIMSKVTDPGKSFFLANSTWRTDIVTFCSHARIDSVLGNARITHIQARKSRRLPFLHEYLLVFFTAAGNQHFVMRIDRLGKVGFTSANGIQDQPIAGTNVAIQEVGVYHVQDSHHGLGDEGPWLEMDGVWGSHPVATLVTWEHMGIENPSHHVRTAAGGPQRPRLRDVSRLLEAILLEMPSYHLTTTNCYFMTRSSLILLQRCYPHAFACYLGAVSDILIPGSALAEPVWAGMLRWYLPFALAFFLTYIPLIVALSYYIWQTMSCVETHGTLCPSSSRMFSAFKSAMHAVLDVPFPIGLMHAYMTSLEVSMNKLIVNLSAQFSMIQGATVAPESPQTQPFQVLFDDAWETLAAWCALGAIGGILVFVSLAVEYGILTVFCVVLVFCVWFNLKFGDSRIGVDEDDLEAVINPQAGIQAPQPSPRS